MKKKENKKLFFLSGTSTSDNKKAMKHLSNVLNRKKLFTYIPSQKYDTEGEFQLIKNDFKKIGFKKHLYMPLDKDFSRSKFNDCLDSDVIFLGGGNTFYFQDSLKKRRITKNLKTFVKNGGTLIGLSAGAIMMSPNILLGGFPREDADENDVNLTKMKGLGLVNFEICPHYKNSKKMISNLKAYTALYQNPLYGLKDGEFIYVCGKQIFFSGQTPLFKNGSKINLT